MVEALRKPRTGLKLSLRVAAGHVVTCRSTQKTQNGIETSSSRVRSSDSRGVEALRKPRTGLKQPHQCQPDRDPNCRSTQKTQNGIETRSGDRVTGGPGASKHSENPERD